MRSTRREAGLVRPCEARGAGAHGVRRECVEARGARLVHLVWTDRRPGLTLDFLLAILYFHSIPI